MGKVVISVGSRMGIRQEKDNGPSGYVLSGGLGALGVITAQIVQTWTEMVHSRARMTATNGLRPKEARDMKL